MAVDLTGSEGLFTRLGALGGLALASARQQAATAAGLDTLLAAYTTAGDHRAIVASLELSYDQYVRSSSPVVSVLQTVAQATLLRMVAADRPAAGRSVPDALRELVRQMRAATQSVMRCVVTAAATAFTDPAPTGDGVVVLATKRGDGLEQEDATAETGRLLCTADSYSGGATAGGESFQFTGADSTAGLWDYDYPTGSGSVVSLTARQPSDGPLANTNFETWSGSPLAADDWTIDTGVWATNAVRTATPHAGTYSLKLVAGATLTTIHQDFATGDLTPLNSLAVCFWMRTVSGVASGGVLTVELTDGSNVVTEDDQGTANSFAVSFNTLTTAWTSATGVFRIPSVPPSTLRLRLRVSTALAGADVLVDDLATSPLTALSLGGPGAAVFAGATPFIAGDGWDVTIANDRGGQPYLATFQALFDRLFSMRSLGILLPSNPSPSIPDVPFFGP